MALNIHLPTAGLIGVSAIGSDVITDADNGAVLGVNSVNIVEGSTARTFYLPNPARFPLGEAGEVTNGAVIIFKLKTTGEPTITIDGQTASDSDDTRVKIEGENEDDAGYTPVTASALNTIVTFYYVDENWGWILGPGTV